MEMVKKKEKQIIMDTSSSGAPQVVIGCDKTRVNGEKSIREIFRRFGRL